MLIHSLLLTFAVTFETGPNNAIEQNNQRPRVWVYQYTQRAYHGGSYTPYGTKASPNQAIGAILHGIPRRATHSFPTLIGSILPYD